MAGKRRVGTMEEVGLDKRKTRDFQKTILDYLEALKSLRSGFRGWALGRQILVAERDDR